ncbi:hypothetical protein MFIFM68171_11334 [Madurella fahalii]|uniref:DUF7791 domain-containing protein n=1 Tax=Madurella fahalii TaxID=1157608 RepID=A0ABQ0GTQ1_9PEZI
MEAYARDKLDDISDKKANQELVGAIIDKAEGIFLWVALVVKQMRDQLENGEDPAGLMQVVDSLPDELDDLYEHILKSLSKSDRKRAYQTLAILPLSTLCGLPVSLFAYSFLDKYDDNKTFAERDDFAQTGMYGMTYEKRIQLGRKRVNGWCKGLVEPARNKIDYAHRSIPEFLQREDIEDEMESALADYSAAEALSQLILAECRLEFFYDPPQGDFRGRNFSDFVRMRQEHGLDHAPFTFLRSLDAILDTTLNKQVWAKLQARSINSQIWLPLYNSVSSNTWQMIALVTSDQEGPGKEKSLEVTFLNSALHICAFIFPDHGYPVWWATKEATTSESVAKGVLLAYAVFARQIKEVEVNWPILDALFDRGLLSSRTRTTIMPIYPLRHDVNDSDTDPRAGADADSAPDSKIATSSTTIPKYGKIELSVWQHYLISQWLFQQQFSGSF